MVFTVADFREWVHVLYDHPEWREELRRLVLTDELLELPDIVRELAEAQRELAAAQQRTEQQVKELAAAQRELAAAQRRTEQQVEELAAAQRRTEQRVEELAAAQRRTEQQVKELAAAQRRTEQRVEELAAAQGRLGSAVGELQRAFGATIEEEAAGVVEVVLRRKGYRVLQPAYSLALDGEIDVVLPLEDLSGEQVWAVVEAKARLSRRDVHQWAQRMRSAGWRERLAERGVKGPYLVYVYSIRADLSAQEMARQTGIGLLKSDGEIPAPRRVD